MIVEQVSPEHKQLVEINLVQAEVAGIELTETANPSPEITHNSKV